jgi:hypothetical protein
MLYHGEEHLTFPYSSATLSGAYSGKKEKHRMKKQIAYLIVVLILGGMLWTGCVGPSPEPTSTPETTDEAYPAPPAVPTQPEGAYPQPTFEPYDPYPEE